MLHYLLVACLVPIIAQTEFYDSIVEKIFDYSPAKYQDFVDIVVGCSEYPWFPFACLFIFRYLRLVVHIISFWCFYKPTPLPPSPTVLRQDVSIILPTVDPENADFKECLQSCLNNYPGEIMIVTVGKQMTALTNQIVHPYRTAFPQTDIQVHSTNVANKRIQVAYGVGFANGKVTVLLDDHVFWPSLNFLPTLLAPFEDDTVGAVGTNKRVRRTDTGFNIRSFWNMIGALYLERHNFEIRSTNAIDGGVFVISGRTAAYRTSILKQPGFLTEFTNEKFFFGKFGPLNADDDNFLTRQVVRQGYKIKIQYSQDALIETTLGTYPKFLSQCLRWVRTTWRSNSASLFTDGTVWYSQPWCVYAVYITSFFNFALFNDAALVYLLRTFAGKTEIYCLIGWIFATKMVKLTPYFLREPQDLLMLPGYFLFAYFHSFIKLYAGLTFWVTAWGGRNLDAVNQDQDTGNGSPDGDDSHSSRRSSHVSANSFGTAASSSSTSSFSSSDSTAPTPFPPAARDGFANTASDRTSAPPPQIRTPWGFVSTNNRAMTPANVLESQFATRSCFSQYRDVRNPLSASTVTSYSSADSDGSSSSSSSDISPHNSIDDHAETKPRQRSNPWGMLTPSTSPARRTNNTFTPYIPYRNPSVFRNDFKIATPTASNTLCPSSPNSTRDTPISPTSQSNLSVPTKSPMQPVTPSAQIPKNHTPYPFNTAAEPVSHNYLSARSMPRERHALGIPDYYSKFWRRGSQCQCLHPDGDKFFKTRPCRCLVEDLFVVGQTVMPGRPRV